MRWGRGEKGRNRKGGRKRREEEKGKDRSEKRRMIGRKGGREDGKG